MGARIKTGNLLSGEAKTLEFPPDWTVTEDGDNHVTVVSGGSQPSKQTVALIGDSITDRNKLDNTATAIGHNSRGYWSGAAVYRGPRPPLLRCAGVSGERTDQIAARLSADVLAFNPGWCVVQAGVNDVSQGVSAATIIANLTSIYTTLRAAGIRVVATTITPNNASSAPQKLVRAQVNEWMRAYALTVHGIVLCDWSAAVTSITSEAWNGAAPSLSPDGIHPNTYGAARMGRKLADVIAPYLPATPALGLPVSNLDPTNAVQNGFFDAGTIAQWAFDAVSTKTQVARTDGIIGNWEQFVNGAAQLAFGRYIQSTPATYMTAGVDFVYAVAEMQADSWTSATDCHLGMKFRDGGAATLLDAWDLFNSQGDVFPIEHQPGYENGATKTMVFRTPAVLVPATTATVWVQPEFNGQGTVRWSRVGIRKLALPMTVLG